MRIATRLGIGYAIMVVLCLPLLVWLGYHEFVEEPAKFAARGVPDIHDDTGAELLTMVFLGLMPILLGLSWWWTRRVLAPLTSLIKSVEQIEPNKRALPRPGNAHSDEVAALTAAFDSMTARLEASFQRIHEFTLHTSHELKTPLTVVRAQLETLLREEGPLPSPQKEWVQNLLDEVGRLTKIVDSLTLLTKADAGLVVMERDPVAFGELVQEAYEDALMLAQDQRLNVTLTECPKAPLVGDRHRLRQMLLILTDNAVKYSRPEGEICFSLGEHNGTAELRIVNDGEGFSPEISHRLFDRFVRGENAKGKVEGCGLGLTIAQWIVNTHGGTIELIPEPSGRTTAAVRLPLALVT